MTLEEIFAAAKRGATVLTANNRVARALLRGYSGWQQKQRRGAWQSPRVLAWKSWLLKYREEARWAGGDPLPLLLAAHQETAVWESVIADSPAAAGLLQVPGAAAEARDAWALLHAWKLPFPDPAWQDGQDAGAFLGWALAYQARCARENWLDEARLPDLIGDLIQLGQGNVPERILLIGFDEFTPQQLNVWTYLRAAGCTVDEVAAEAAAVPGRAVRVSLPGAAEEIQAAAGWARTLLEQQPAAAIGIVVPELAERRAALDRIFREVLAPGSVLPGAAQPDRLFNISLGLPLAEYPAIHAALQVLHLAVRPLSYPETGSVLRSPFLAGSVEEHTRRALLHAGLSKGAPEIGLRSLSRRAALADCPVLAANLDRLLDQCDDRRRPPSGWARVFANWLAAAGWPGDRSPTSAEFQTVRAFNELLSGFAALDRAVPSLDAARAVARLARMAREEQFQPEGPDTPIQVLGVFEASGMQFDALWVMGMHDGVWPAPPRPNPFLPLGVQRRMGLPHSSAERELVFLRRVTARLLASAPDVVVSAPRRTGDRELRVSPLVASLPEIPIDGARPETLAERMSARLEELVDETGPPVPAGPLLQGSRVFQLQAACPFRAFAELRLGAGEPGAPEPGLSAAERGSVAHAALETFWRELGTSEALGDDAAVAAAIRHAADAALQRIGSQRRLPEWHLTLERNRLLALLAEWAALEKSRPPFRVADAERRRHIAVEGLELEIRIDRIDELPGGRKAIIDYKTGKPDIGQWGGERPDEPQLPLYAVHAETAPAALAFAQVRRGEMRWLGLADAAGLLPGVRESEIPWAEQIARWDGVLRRLAREFRGGRAEVDPKDPSKTCRNCPVTPLCRIHELTGAVAPEDQP